ncbi:hypothetical protein SSTU70S_02458 [Stutzerimonas stutzeri]
MAEYGIAQCVLPGAAHTGFGVFEEYMIDLRKLAVDFLLGAQFQLAHQVPSSSVQSAARPKRRR